MSYQRFAHVYDYLMQDVPYGQWVEYFERNTGKPSGQKVLDLACGTGEFTIHLAQSGWDVTGVDLSENMLMVAQQKANDLGVRIPFFLQDMRNLEGLGAYHAVTIFCDSLNYLTEEADVKQTFARVYEHLLPGGVFLFDVHSLYKMREIFIEGTFTETDEEVSYIWNCFPGEYPDSIEHELTFFALDPANGLYERFDEIHTQRTFAPEAYHQWLEEAGFELQEITADFKPESPHRESERIFFSAIKK
ncbi:MAG TPA: methyltransferase domain-containing protein [Chondromyces sp.]|nr:methyltransferase domain-containing protein [Chondromyces sp.]